MKSQRRHDLQTNTLADNLAETLEYLKTQYLLIVVGIVAVLLIIGGIWYWQYAAAARRAQGWQDMLALVGTTSREDPQYIDKLEEVAASARDPNLRAMAYAQVGNELLGQAVFGGEPAEQVQKLQDRAKAAFNASLSTSAKSPEAGAISRLGLAAIAADNGDATAAREYYEAVRSNPNLTGMPYPAQASAGLAALDAAAKLPPLAASSQPAAAEAAPATQPSDG